MKDLAVLFVILAIIACSLCIKPTYTQVTCMYDIKRGDLTTYKQSFSIYLENFSKMLESDTNLIIFGGKEVRDFVWKRRKESNTIFVQREIDEFKKYWFAPLAEKLRSKFIKDLLFPYKEHPQYALEHYNLIMFSKLYLMVEAQRYDKWNTDFLVWTDGGLMHIFPQNLVSPQNVIQKFYQFVQPQWILFTYFQQNTVFKKGFQKTEFRYLGRNAKSYEAVLAGHQGGFIEIVKDIKNAFQNLLRITLENGDMNSDETVVAVIPIRYPFLIPNTVNIYLNNFVNKFNIYEDIKRFSRHPRFFEGKFDSYGRLTVRNNKTLTKYTYHPTNKYAGNIFSLEEMQMIKQMSFTAKKQTQYLTKILSLQRTKIKNMSQKKIKLFAFMGILLITLLLINKHLKESLKEQKDRMSGQYVKINMQQVI